MAKSKLKEITLSKTVKVPVPGVAFSNQQVSVTHVYEIDESTEAFDTVKAGDNLNQDLTIVKENEPSWIHQLTKENGEVKK